MDAPDAPTMNILGFRSWYRLLLSICIVSSCLLLAATHSLSRQNIDYLVPVNETVDAAYEKLLNHKLYQTPANYVRIVVLPSAALIGERAFSLHSKTENPELITLTYTQADKNIWSAAFAMDVNLAREPRVKIRRRDVGFPKTLAVLLTERIGEMVRKSREPGATDRIVIDGTSIIFLVAGQKGATVRAKLAPESEGRNSRALRGIKDLLREYCEASVADRSALARKIEVTVRQLSL
jgi:hypothetical protein